MNAPTNAPTQGTEPKGTSWYESSARVRVSQLLDEGSFTEFLGPQERQMSPNLKAFDLPEQFDDGMIVGRGLINDTPVFVAAQEGRFMGGAFGEVHGAKLTGLLRAARDVRSIPVLILFDTGGVRLQEANAGELAIAEIMRAVIEARIEGLKVVGLIGGRAGCYGGGGLIAGCCSALAVSEQGRISVSGPEVIETNRGVEEFDSKDRALVWRTMGGKHRHLIGGADAFVDDTTVDFRKTAVRLLAETRPFNLKTLQDEQARLEWRIQNFGNSVDAIDIWQTMGIADASSIPEMTYRQFEAAVQKARRPDHAAR